jgi:phosphate/sulfate permease
VQRVSADGTRTRHAELQEFLRDPAKAEDIQKTLSIGSKVPFKAFKIHKPTAYATTAVGVIIGAALLIAGYACKDESLYTITVSTLLYPAVVFLIGYFVSKSIAKYLNVKSWVRQRLLLAIGFSVMSLFSIIYIETFNRIYNRAGKIPVRKEEK